MSTVVLRDARQRLMFLGFLGLIFVLVASGTRNIAAQPKDDGFVFSSNSVVSAMTTASRCGSESDSRSPSSSEGCTHTRSKGPTTARADAFMYLVKMGCT